MTIVGGRAVTNIDGQDDHSHDNDDHDCDDKSYDNNGLRRCDRH